MAQTKVKSPQVDASVSASLDNFTSSTKGVVPASGGGTTNFLRADGTWAAPSGGSGTVTSVTLTQPAAGITLTNSGVSQTTTVTSTVALANDLAALEGLTGTGLARRTGADTWTLDTSTYLTGNQTITISGDATGSGTTAITLTIPTFTSSTKGVVPASGGGTTNFLRADGTWAPASGGGGGPGPGGPSGSIQLNGGSSFSGDADFSFDTTTKVLSLTGTDTTIVLNGITNEPAAPSAGSGIFYAKTISGKVVPKWKGPSGLDFPLQTAFWQNNIVMWNPTTATAGVWLGTAGAGAGTYTTALPTTTNLYTSMKRARWANVATTANQVLGQRNTELLFRRGSIAGQGGFFFFARCGTDVWTNGARFFAGMHTSTAVVTADPSAHNNCVGFCVDAADNGAIHFLTRGTSATKAATGFTLAANTGFDLYIFCAPNSSQYTWRIVNINTGAEASGTATATLPTNTTMQTAGVLASNAALTAATSIQVGLNRIYVETDY